MECIEVVNQYFGFWMTLFCLEFWVAVLFAVKDFSLGNLCFLSDVKNLVVEFVYLLFRK